MSWRDACLGFYRGLIPMIAPRLRFSQSLYEDVLREHARSEYYWLDLGCGHNLLPPWRLAQETELARCARVLVGLDYSVESLRRHGTIGNRVRGDISDLPFTDGAFDLVTANMVFEHVTEPNEQFAEVFRILKPGGLLIFHTPNALGYTTVMARIFPERLKAKMIYFLEDRSGEDVFTTVYRINSVASIRRAAARAGFSVNAMRLIVSTPQFIMVPPVVVIELLFIRLLMTKLMRPFRTNIIAILQKPLPPPEE